MTQFEQVKKSLECCIKGDCYNCSYKDTALDFSECVCNHLMRDLLDILNEVGEKHERK